MNITDMNDSGPLAFMAGFFIGVIVLAIMLTSETSSNSGAMKVLRENGEVSHTDMYKMDTLYYAPNGGYLIETELKALAQLSDEYIVAINY